MSDPDPYLDEDIERLQKIYRSPGVFIDWGVGTIFFTAALDQVVKWWIIEHLMNAGRGGLGFFKWYATSMAGDLPYFKAVALTPFFNLVMVWNKGVSFGLGNQNLIFVPDTMDFQTLSLISLALLICAAVVVWMMVENRRVPVMAMGLVVGGALGNVIDRIRFGAVADFFDVHVMGIHWPAFNIADAAVVIGVAIILYDHIFLRPVIEEGR